MKYDSLDLKIVRLLLADGRRPFAEIARELSVPAAVVQARYAKMKKAGLIMGSAVILEPSKIGLTHAASIGIVARESDVDEVKRYIERLKVENALMCVWNTFGRYNIAVAVFLKNVEGVFRIKNMIKLHPAVESVDVSLSQNVHYSVENLDIEKILE